MSESIRLQKSSLMIYRVFDVAEEINLSLVEDIAKTQARLRLGRTGHHAVVIKNAPVVISLGDVAVQLGRWECRADMTAKLWDYGVVSVSFQIPMPENITWSELVGISCQLSLSTPGNAVPSTNELPRFFDSLAERKVLELSQTLAGAFKRAAHWSVSEDYTVFFIEKFEGASNPKELIDQVDVPALLLSEPAGHLSEQSKRGLFEYVYQYAKDDLVVIDWNSALVIEPTAQREVAEVLEFVVTQLLEMRYYDDLLDSRLAELYDAIEAKRASPLQGYFSRLAHEANTRYVEFAEVLERVNNSLKVVGDFYLAVIFRASIRRFRIPDWQTSITRKMELLAKTTELLQGETNVIRSHLLELTVVFLILFEIISAMIHK